MLLGFKIAALVTVALVVPTSYVAYYNGFLTNPSALPENVDSDYEPQVPPSSVSVDKLECFFELGFCYENIWKLARKFREEHPEELQNMYAVFVSGSGRLPMIAVWNQILGIGKSGFLDYNYHVVLVYSKNKNSWVYDFDSSLPFPEDLRSYFSQTFRIKSKFLERFQPVFRVIKAETFLDTFDPVKDSRIVHGDSPIYKYITMDRGQPNSEKYGVVLDRFQFLNRFS